MLVWDQGQTGFDNGLALRQLAGADPFRTAIDQPFPTTPLRSVNVAWQLKFLIWYIGECTRHRGIN